MIKPAANYIFTQQTETRAAIIARDVPHQIYCKTPIIRVLEIFALFASSKKTRKLQAREKWEVSYVYQIVWRENYKHTNCLVGRFRENFMPRIIGILQ